MPDWKILITDGLQENGKEILNSAEDINEARDAAGISPEELLETVGEYHALIVRSRTKVNEEIFDAARNLKVVGRAGVGVDNIDLAAANAHGVTVVNSPTATSIAVAEHTLALMFSLARSIPRADASMKTGQWAKKELEGIELTGKTLGIVGMGNIGEK